MCICLERTASEEKNEDSETVGYLLHSFYIVHGY